MSPPLLCIMGPTASGKTQLAIDLAEALNGELISVDSALVYRGLDIGSAKPSYPHHLVDVCDPGEAYSAARFAEDATRLIDEIETCGRRPILVGGTMLYYRALLQGMAPMPGADQAIRSRLTLRAQEEGWPALHRDLQRVDPESAARIHPNHSQRLLRALEVHELTGRTLTELHGESPSRFHRGEVLAVALAPVERSVLHERISIRLRQMLDQGFLAEVAALHGRGDLHAQLPALRAVGYRQLWEHLDGCYSLEEAHNKALAATRQLAKRQFTWLRKWPQLQWLLTDAEGMVLSSDLGFPRDTVERSHKPADVLLNYLASNPM